MRKKTSTNFLNENIIKNKCSIALVVSLLSGRWKPSILWYLQEHKELTYTNIKAKIPEATDRMLVKQLQELSGDKLIEKIPVAEKTVYVLTTNGLSILPIMEAMEKWGNKYRHINSEMR
jgi:DNA-binding HxlR family transcriptional regulator